MQVIVLQLEKSLSEKSRSSLELEQKLESERQALQSAKAMLEDRISEAQSSKSEWQDLKHQVGFYNLINRHSGTFTFFRLKFLYDISKIFDILSSVQYLK